jgi:hypothetical protein
VQDGHDAVLTRVGLTIMDELAPSLLQLHDFEALLSRIKAEPIEWDDVQLEQVRVWVCLECEVVWGPRGQRAWSSQ